MIRLKSLAPAPLKLLTLAFVFSTMGAHAATLVEKDGSYATVPLEKDKVVIKVVQNLTRNLQDFPDVKKGLAHNLEQMTALTKRACSEGKKPDFILFNEFPLTGYSEGRREEKLKFPARKPLHWASLPSNAIPTSSLAATRATRRGQAISSA